MLKSQNIIHRTTNFWREQVETLLDALETYPQLVTGEFDEKIPTKRHRTLAWEAVAQKVSEVGPARTWEQAKAKWIDLKYRTRAKARKLQNFKPYHEVFKYLSEVEKRVLAIIGETNPKDQIILGKLQPLKAVRFINSNEKIIMKTNESSDEPAEHDSFKIFLQEIGNEFIDDENSINAEPKISEVVSLSPTARKRQGTSSENDESFQRRKRKRIAEEGIEERMVAAQERMALDIYNIKLSVAEMKDNMNVYMKRIDEKFDKMLDLLAVALNVESHDMTD